MTFKLTWTRGTTLGVKSPKIIKVNNEILHIPDVLNLWIHYEKSQRPLVTTRNIVLDYISEKFLSNLLNDPEYQVNLSPELEELTFTPEDEL